MHLIKECPSCKKKLRFPIDKGKIRVACTCGYSFIADPDDPALYTHSIFDIGTKQKKKKNITGSAFDILANVNAKKIKDTVISYILNKKYNIQNFKYLPKAEQKKLIASFLLFLFITAVIIFLVLFLRSSSIDRGIII